MVKWSFKLWILETLKFFDLPAWVGGVNRLINISRDYDVKPQVQTLWDYHEMCRAIPLFNLLKPCETKFRIMHYQCWSTAQRQPPPTADQSLSTHPSPTLLSNPPSCTKCPCVSQNREPALTVKIWYVHEKSWMVTGYQPFFSAAFQPRPSSTRSLGVCDPSRAH